MVQETDAFEKGTLLDHGFQHIPPELDQTQTPRGEHVVPKFAATAQDRAVLARVAWEVEVQVQRDEARARRERVCDVSLRKVAVRGVEWRR